MAKKEPTSKEPPFGLTLKQAQFCLEYIIDKNATKAAIRCGYSEKTAHAQGSRLLKNVKVKAYLGRLIEKQEKRLDIKADVVLRELHRILTSDIGKVFNPEGGILPVADMDEDVRRAISGIKVKEIWEYTDEGRKRSKEQVGEVVEIKFWSKTESANLLGKNLKLWLERHEHEIGPTLSKLLEESYE